MTPKNKEYIQQLRNTIGRIEMMVQANRFGLAKNELVFLRNQAMDYRTFLSKEGTQSEKA